MSQYTEIMEELAALREQNDWLVQAMKHLLTHPSQAEWQPEAPLAEYENDELDLDDEPIDDGPGDVLVPIHRPRVRTAPCPHNRQGVDDFGNLVCNRCGDVLVQSGVVQNRVGPNGGIMADPHPPGWTQERSPGASSKNPGGALVPN